MKKKELRRMLSELRAETAMMSNRIQVLNEENRILMGEVKRLQEAYHRVGDAAEVISGRAYVALMRESELSRFAALAEKRFAEEDKALRDQRVPRPKKSGDDQ